MLAIYDKLTNFVGWLDEAKKDIYDRNMEWLGFIQNKNVFSTHAKWLGGFEKGTFVDKLGRPVAWGEGYSPKGCLPLSEPLTPLKRLHPLTPLKPLMPLRPLKPLAPLGGWSQYSWEAYWNQ